MFAGPLSAQHGDSVALGADGAAGVPARSSSSAERGTTNRRPSRSALNSPRRTHSYADEREMPSICAASSTVTVHRSIATSQVRHAPANITGTPPMRAEPATVWKKPGRILPIGRNDRLTTPEPDPDHGDGHP